MNLQLIVDPFVKLMIWLKLGNVAVVGPRRRSELNKRDNVRERAQCEGGKEG